MQQLTGVTEVLVDYGIKWDYSNNDTMKKVRRVRDASRSRLYTAKRSRIKEKEWNKQKEKRSALT